MTEKLKQKNRAIINKNLEKVCNQIKSLMEMIPEDEMFDEKIDVAIELCVFSSLQGSNSLIEQVGILDQSKESAREVFKQVTEEVVAE